MNTIGEILKYTIPSIILFLTVYALVRNFFKSETEKRTFELRYNNAGRTLPLRLQAYERLTLFLERMVPGALVRRVGGTKISASQQHAILVQTIRTEFEHNLSQQIYISAELWAEVDKAKEEMLAIINRVFASLPPKATAAHLNTRMLQYFMENKDPIPSARALNILNQEVKKIL